MAYSWQTNNQNNSAKYSWQSGGLGKTKNELVEDEKKERISQGLPVSLSKNRAEPGILQNIVAAPLKPLADVGKNLLNAGEVLVGKEKTKSLYSPLTGKVEGLGEVDITKSPLAPENRKVIKKSAATGAELASYLGYGGVAKGAVQAGLSKSAQTAAKQTFAEYVTKMMPSLLKEGALTGVAYTAGSQGREEDKDFDWNQALTDVASSTILTPLAALGIRKLFGTGTKKIIDARIAEKKATKFNIPEAGVPPESYIDRNLRTPKERLANYSKKMGYEPYTNPNDLPVINAGKTPKESTVKFGKDTPNVYSGTDSQLPKQPPETPNSTLLNKGLSEAPSPQRPLNTVDAPVSPKAVETPEIKTKVDEGVDVLTRNMPESVQGGNLRQYSSTVYEDMAKDLEKAKRIALGQELPNNGVPSDAYYAIVANEAEKAGDIDLLKQLSRSDSVASTSGIKLQANKLRTKGGVLDDMREVRKSRQLERGITDERFAKEQSSLLDNLKKKIADTADITKQEIDDIVNKLICK